jgi:hypothetical protein
VPNLEPYYEDTSGSGRKAPYIKIRTTKSSFMLWPLYSQERIPGNHLIGCNLK